MMTTISCHTDSELRDFDRGICSADRSEQVARHLDECPTCAARFQNLAAEPDPFLEQLRRPLPNDVLQDDAESIDLVRRTLAAAETAVGAGEETVIPESSPQRADIVADLIGMLAPPEADDELGRLGGYRVLKLLGAGGMGAVFRAENLRLKRVVALKVMKPTVAAAQNARERFLREAQAVAAVENDHVVAIYEVGEDRGIPFLAMPLLQGESLGSRLQRENRLLPDEALRIVREAAAGLSAAHARGLVHRDVKPDNLWLEAATGRVKLLDFGLARATEGEQQLTQAGLIVGTPNYLSPEQVQGDAIDVRTDLFSLGVVLYQVLTGDLPFLRNNMVATLSAISSAPPREMDERIPADVQQLVLRMLEKRPEKRLATADEVIVAIDECRHRLKTAAAVGIGDPTAATQAARSPVDPPAKRNRRVLIALVAAATVLMAGVIITVRDKNGNLLARLFAPGDASVVIEPENPDREAIGKPVGPAIPSPIPAVVPGVPEALPPMSPLALVQSPAKLISKTGKPVLSWTVVTRGLLSGGVPMPALRQDGKRLAVFTDDGLVRIWEAPSGRLLQVLAGHGEGPALWSPDTRRSFSRTRSRRYGPIAWQGTTPLLATASRDGSVWVWNVESGQVVFRLEGERDGINMLAWSPDGSMLAVARSSDGGVRCWQADGWKEMEPLDPVRRLCLGLAWSPDSKSLAVGTNQSSLLWAPATGETRILPEPSRVKDVVLSGAGWLDWSPDGQRLALIQESQIAILDSLSLEPVQQLRMADDASAVPLHLSWSPRGKEMLISWGLKDQKRVTQIMDVATGKVVQTLPNGPDGASDSVEWLPDEQTVIVGNRVIDRESGKFKELLGSHWDASADGKWILSRNQPWLPLVLENPAGEASLNRVPMKELVDSRPKLSVLLSPDNRSLALSDDVHCTQILDRLASPSQRRLRTYPRMIHTWSPNGKYTVSYDHRTGGLICCSWPDGELIQKLPPIGPYAWSDDGLRLAIGASDMSLRVIDVAGGQTGEPWGDPLKIKNYITSIAWARNGSLLAACQGNRKIAILDAANGVPRVELESDASINIFPAGLTWSPDDQRVLFVGDADVLVYDSQTGKLIQRIAAAVTPLSVGGPGRLPIHFRDSHRFVFLSAAGALSEADIETGQVNVLRPLPGDGIQFSADGSVVLTQLGNMPRISRVEDGRLLASFISSKLLVSADGHLWTPDNPSGSLWPTSPGVEGSVLYIVQTAEGQSMLTPLEFANQYGWENHPEKLRLD